MSYANGARKGEHRDLVGRRPPTLRLIALPGRAPSEKKSKRKMPNKDATAKRVAVPDAEWFKARIGRLGLTQTAVAAKIGVRKETMGRMLTGARPADGSDVAALAAVLQSSPSEILRRLGHPVSGGLTISGRVLEDGHVSQVVDADAGHVNVGDYPVDVVALLVEAPVGPLSPWDGAVLVYLPNQSRAVGPEFVGRICIIEDASRPLPIVGCIQPATGAQPNRIRVFGTGEEIPVRRLVRASPVLGVHFRP